MPAISPSDLTTVQGGANEPVIKVLVPLGPRPAPRPPTPGDRLIDNNTDKPIKY